MSFVTSSDGKKIWYDVMGSGEPLVLIGGSSLVHRQWDFILSFLRDRFKVILYDQRGAGLSARPSKEITVEQWVDDLKMILDDIGVEKTHLFGTSNGSFIVIRFAAKYPERTGAIVHYGMHKLTDQSAGMSRIGATICDEFGVGNGSLGAYFLVRLYGMPSAYEEWETQRFERIRHFDRIVKEIEEEKNAPPSRQSCGYPHKNDSNPVWTDGLYGSYRGIDYPECGGFVLQLHLL